MPDSPSLSESTACTIPTAIVAPARRTLWVWLIPLAALVAVMWLAWSAWANRGVAITITLSEGHGLKAGDAIRHRGIDIGSVDFVVLSAKLDAVIVHATLESSARNVAREGARFWVVRPEFGLHRISGLETIVGARYLAMTPSPNTHAAPTRQFTALDRPPIADLLQPGGRHVRLTATRRGGIVPGTPLTYRQVQVGVVVTVELAADSTTVQISAIVDPQYAPLVRENSVFWMAGGFDLTLGLKGFAARLDSFESLVASEIAFTTPDTPGKEASNGAMFELANESEKDWLQWQPSIPLARGAATKEPKE